MPDDALPSSGDTLPAANPTLTVTLGNASVTVEIADTIREGENFYKRHVALTLPVNYPPAQRVA